MNEDFVIELARLTMVTAAILSAPTLITVVVVGVIINVLQTVTQIRDPALAFVPKCIAVVLVLLLLGPWHLQIMAQYTETIFNLVALGAQ